MISNIIRKVSYDPYIITKKLLRTLNLIIQPDISLKEIIPKEDGDISEIHFANEIDTLIPLSKMGSGIKTILLVVLQMEVIPEIHFPQKKKEDLVFCFEELENNLHPALQRRLFSYISDYAKKNKSLFFITTHSNVAIDLFSLQDEKIQILHVQNDNETNTSTVRTVLGKECNLRILKDLDYKPSDLLLSNGVIWVEGPSDALYLELFIRLYQNSQRSENLPKLNYTIQSLSTAIWKYAGFQDFNWDKVDDGIENKIIDLTKVNHNHLILIDKDDNYENKPPSEFASFGNGTGKNKARLIYESLKYADLKEEDLADNYGRSKDEKLYFLITPGTFETYLEYFINNKGKEKFEKYFDLGKIRGYFEKRRDGSNYSISKVELASEICQYIIQEKLTLRDLTEDDNSELYYVIRRLYNTICSWK